MQPGLTYCQRVGNIMGGDAVMLSLASTIDHGAFDTPAAHRLLLLRLGLLLGVLQRRGDAPPASEASARWSSSGTWTTGTS